MNEYGTKHGEWKINPDGYYPYCSECHTEPKNGVMSNYCPECGAKMDGKVELNNPEIVLKVIELRNKGYKVADIAKKLCYSERQIYRILKKVR